MVKDNIFGEQIRSARIKKGWTQEELAHKMVGIQSKQNISNWERGVCLPIYEVRLELEELLEINVENERTTSMDIKPLIEIENLKETEQAIETIIKGFNYQSTKKEYIEDILRKLLWLMVGYYRYIVDINEKKQAKLSNWSYEAPIWNYISEDLLELLNPQMDRFETQIPFEGRYPISRKIHAIIYKIGAELFEDFDENGYRDGYIQQVAGEGESCGYDLIKLFPASGNETDTTMEIRYAIYKLSNYMSGI